jgi:tRNA threonylcarbamoyladenosine biosynthesis protein TsaB
MLILALDTSSDLGSLALLQDGAVLSETHTGGRMEHAAQLFPKLQQLLGKTRLRLNEIDLYAVGIGPGSFNGIRIGIAALKGLRLATNKPIVGVCSADAIATDAAARCPPDCAQIAVITDARRGEWYFSLYRLEKGGVTNLGGHRTIAPEKIPSLLLAPTLVVGPDNAALRQRFLSLKCAHGVRFEENATTPRAAIVGKLGAAKFLAQGAADPVVEPLYLRQPVLAPQRH